MAAVGFAAAAHTRTAQRIAREQRMLLPHTPWRVTVLLQDVHPSVGRLLYVRYSAASGVARGQVLPLPLLARLLRSPEHAPGVLGVITNVAAATSVAFDEDLRTERPRQVEFTFYGRVRVFTAELRQLFRDEGVRSNAAGTAWEAPCAALGGAVRLIEDLRTRGRGCGVDGASDSCSGAQAGGAQAGGGDAATDAYDVAHSASPLCSAAVGATTLVHVALAGRAPPRP